MPRREPANREGLDFRLGTTDDPAVRAGILALLWDIFGLDFGPAAALWGWPADYRAHSWMDGETIAANVSTRPLPLVVADRRVDALQIHCVATRPAYRGRGLFTDLMGRILAEADRRYECVVLYTVTPELYRPFGFRPLPEHRFRGTLDGAPAADVARRDLALGDPADLAIVRDAFARRQPVSRRLGLVDNGDVFAVNALHHPAWRLTWLPDSRALVVWERAAEVTRLHDVVAPAMPAASMLAAALELHATRAAEIEVLFPPDRVAGRFAPVPHLPEDEDILCVRGPFAIEGEAFMLPLTAMS